MSAPTPVSALLHSSTMVIAGTLVGCVSYGPALVYVMLNSYYSFLLYSLALYLVTLTLVYSCFYLLYVSDIKSLIAYSTINQLAYIFLALFSFNFAYSIYHICTHAFFKSMLFLLAGSLIHVCSSAQSLYRLKSSCSLLKSLFAISLLLSLLNFSKELILHYAHLSLCLASHFYVFSFSIIVTAAYSFKLFYCVFAFGSTPSSAPPSSSSSPTAPYSFSPSATTTASPSVTSPYIPARYASISHFGSTPTRPASSFSFPIHSISTPASNSPSASISHFASRFSIIFSCLSLPPYVRYAILYFRGWYTPAFSCFPRQHYNIYYSLPSRHGIFLRSYNILSFLSRFPKRSGNIYYSLSAPSNISLLSFLFPSRLAALLCRIFALLSRYPISLLSAPPSVSASKFVHPHSHPNFSIPYSSQHSNSVSASKFRSFRRTFPNNISLPSRLSSYARLVLAYMFLPSRPNYNIYYSFSSFVLIFYALTVLVVDSLFVAVFSSVSLSYNSFSLASTLAVSLVPVPLNLYMLVFAFSVSFAFYVCMLLSNSHRSAFQTTRRYSFSLLLFATALFFLFRFFFPGTQIE